MQRGKTKYDNEGCPSLGTSLLSLLFTRLPLLDRGTAFTHEEFFPDLELCVLTCRAKRVTDAMLATAALAPSEFLDAQLLSRSG